MITIYTLILLGAIGLQAFFTATEMAFTSISRIKIKHLAEEGDVHAIKLREFLHRKGLFLSTTLFGTNIAVVISSALATRIFVEYLGAEIAPLIATVIMVPTIIVFAEIIPKIIARQYSDTIALKTVVPLDGFKKIFYPIIRTINSIANILILPFSGHKTPWDVNFTKSDLKSILISGHEMGEVEEDEVMLIHKVLDLGAKKAENFMVPLYKVSSISEDDTLSNLKELVSLTGFSRIPVYKNSKDELFGIANIYDVLYKTEDENEHNEKVTGFVREGVFINKNDGLDIALARLRHRKQPMGIVVDEKNKAVGIITIEDILEEIVGEIEDRG